MKIRAITTLLVLSFCLSCDPDVQPTQPFHITYGFPQTLSRLAGVVTLGNLSILVTRPTAEQSATLTCINESGKIQWSKTLKIPAENGLFVTNVYKLDETTFAVYGNLGTGYPILIHFDIDGNILSSRKYSSTVGLILGKCSANSAGTSVCTGYFSANSQFYGFAFQEDKSGNISWGVSLPGLISDGLTNESGSATFLFPGVPAGTGRQTILKLDNSGTLVKASEVSNSGDLFLEDAVNVGDDFYLTYTDWNTSIVYVIKINGEGEFANGIKLVDCANPELDTRNSSALLAVSILGDLNVIEFDSDLNITNRKTIVNLVGGDNTTLHGVIDASDDAISCVIQPFALDPTFADKGLNVIRFFVKDWETRCEITQSNLTSFPTYFQSSTGSSGIEPLDIQTEDITIEAQDIVLNQTSICK